MSRPEWTLGLNWLPDPSGFAHDSSACLIDGDGTVVALAEEERFTRTKHAISQPPWFAAHYCLRQAGISPRDLSAVAIGWNVPALASENGLRLPRDPSDVLYEATGIRANKSIAVHYVEHHDAHAASAFFASGADQAAVLVVDGAGEDKSISLYRADYTQGLRCIWTRDKRHSLGFLYEATTTALGYEWYACGQTMGLAAYGRARGLEPYPLVDVSGGDVQLAAHSSFKNAEIITNWHALFEGLCKERLPIAIPRHGLDRHEVAVRLAWSAQVAVEAAMEFLVAEAHRCTGLELVCLAGGVALNSAANGRLTGELFAPPFVHDAGVALGAAWIVNPPAGPMPEISPYLGSLPTAGELGMVPYELAGEVAERIIAGQVGAVVEGRAEAGPRALGNRSIIASPTREAIRHRVNAAKQREPWRPFGPLSLRSDSERFWRSSRLSRYMLGAFEVSSQARSAIPAVVHIDGTTRPQDLDGTENLFAIAVLEELRAAHETPVLLNTSFNGHGEPLVNSEAEAFAALDVLPIDFLVTPSGLHLA